MFNIGNICNFCNRLLCTTHKMNLTVLSESMLFIIEFTRVEIGVFCKKDNIYNAIFIELWQYQ